MTSFNVAGLLREPGGARRSIAIRDRYAVLDPDVELAGPLDGRVDLQRTNRGILVRGSIGAPLRRTCARCLDPYIEHVRVTFTEEFLPSVDPHTGTPVAPPDPGEEVLTIDARHEIDLTAVIHDELALTEPMHPLCRPDCPGLCAVCGERLAQGAHAHPDPERDPRLAVLAELRDRIRE